MSPVVRPVYKEGQILGAGDLNAQLEYERLGAVYHERTEHTWGVAQGLTLSKTKRTLTLQGNVGVDYNDVSLSPGRAVDRLGRSIVVLQPIPIEPDLFKQQIAKRDKDTLYPVFIQAIETPRRGETAPGKCNVALATRVEEGLQVSFGSPGDELAVLEQTEAPVDEPLGSSTLGSSTLANRVLVGWVTWDPRTGVEKFHDIATEGNGFRVRYVGVVASDVIAGGGELTLHSRPSGTRYAITIAEDTAGGCKLKFGKQDGNGPVVSVFTVDESGNVTCKSLSPPPVAKTLGESGVSFDGLTLPLPKDVSQEQVDQDKVRLHIQLMPWPHTPAVLTLPKSATATIALPIVVACRADKDRKVTCIVRWQDPTDVNNYIDEPSACTYLIVASSM